MTSPKSRSLMALLTVLALGAAPAFAAPQDGVPTRDGNTWDWRHHEPVPSAVSRKEQAAGIDTSAAQQEKTTDDVESLYRQLIRNAGNR